MSSINTNKKNNVISKKNKKIELILDAAQELFESEGREKLTSEAVAEKSNMSSRPPSNEMGTYELGMKTIRPFKLLDFLQEIVEKAIDQGEIYQHNSFMLTCFLYQITIGTAMIEYGLSRFPQKGGNPTEFEKVITEHKDFVKENREFSLRQLKKFITMMKK